MAMEAQLQIRQNAMEVQEYLTDLFDWEKSIKGKENKQSKANTGSNSMPGPRGRASSSVSEAPKELQAPGLIPGKKPAAPARATKPSSGQEAPLAATAASHTHSSYSKWDKIDVEAMLASDDEEEGGQQQAAARGSGPVASNGQHAAAATTQPALQAGAASVQHLSGAADMVATSTRRTGPAAPSAASASQSASQQGAGVQHPPVRNAEPQTADAWRVRGNDLFKAGQYSYARDCYTRCIELDPGSAVAYANRAMAELKLSQWAEAEEDCTQALARDPAFVKALHRRGVARRQLGQPLLAAQDFEDCMRWEPTNKSLAADREAALAEHMAAAQLPPLALRTRLPVTLQQQPAMPASASHPAQQQQQLQDAAAATMVPAAPAAAVMAAPAGDQSTAAIKQPQQPPLVAGASPRTSSSGTSNTARLVAVTSGAVQQLASRVAAQMRAPRTSTEFEAMWRGLTGDSKGQLAYLALIQPAQLPAIFKSSLTPQLLSSIVEVILAGVSQGAPGDGAAEPAAGSAGQVEGAKEGAGAAAWDSGRALEFLQALSSVPRLEMAAMCIGSGKKGELRAAWTAAFGGEGTAATQRVKSALKL